MQFCNKKSFYLASFWIISSFFMTLNFAETARAKIEKSSENNEVKVVRTRRIKYATPEQKKLADNVNKKNRVRGTATRNQGILDRELPIILSPINHVASTLSSNPSIPVYFPVGNQKVTIHLEENQGKFNKLIWKKDLQVNDSGIVEIQFPLDKVSLEIEKMYRFTVVKKPIVDNRAKDIVAQIWLNRVQPSEQLEAQLDRASNQTDRAIILAENGIWFDAVNYLIARNNSDSQQLLIDLVSQTQLITLIPQSLAN